MSYLKLTGVLILAAVVGCSDAKQPTAKEEALQNWNSTRASVLMSLARDQYKAGTYDKCRQTLIEASRLEPNDADVRVLSAKVYIEQGDLELAEADLKAARTSAPKMAVVEYLSGVIYQRWQQPEKSLEYYDAACKKDSTELAYLMAKAETMVTLGKPAEALDLLQKKVVYFEHSPVIRDAVGMLLDQQGKADEAVDMFRRASILAPDDASIREHLALALFTSKQYAEAADELQRLVAQDALSKRADLHQTLAECLLATGRAPAARQSAQTACDLTPSSPTVWLTMAKVCMELNDLHRAETSIVKARDLDPSPSGEWLLMGYLQLRENNPSAALTSFQRAAALDPKDGTSVCMEGSALEKLNRTSEAMQKYSEALKLNPADDLAGKLMADVEGK